MALIPEEERDNETLRFDTLGVILSLFLLFLVSLPLITPIVIFTRIDPFYYVLEQLFPHPYDRPIPFILTGPLIRLVLTWVSLTEFLRCLSVGLTGAILFCFASYSALKSLVFLGDRDAHHFYSALYLLFSSLPLPLIAFFFIAVGQTLPVSGIWMVIKLGDVLPKYLTWLLLATVLYGIVFGSMLLHGVANLNETSGLILRGKVDKWYVRNCRVRMRFWTCARWRSRRKIEVWCGTFFLLKKGVTMGYLREMINNLVNAVLLINP